MTRFAKIDEYGNVVGLIETPEETDEFDGRSNVVEIPDDANPKAIDVSGGTPTLLDSRQGSQQEYRNASTVEEKLDVLARELGLLDDAS